MLKKVKNGSTAAGRINRADKNSNITLVTLIIMLL